VGNSWVSLRSNSEIYHREWILTRRGLGAKVFFESPEELGVEMYYAEMAHFLDCVREQKPTICPLADGLKVLEVCAQIEQVAA
jgi:predicted dehydrogenase